LFKSCVDFASSGGIDILIVKVMTTTDLRTRLFVFLLFLTKDNKQATKKNNKTPAEAEGE
jgi:hypothetical protein